MGRSNRRWTGADMLKLKDLAQKYPAATIAEQLGRSPTALAVKAHELQLSLRLPRRGKMRTSGGDPRPARV